jgi:hypothetical protein
MNNNNNGRGLDPRPPWRRRARVAAVMTVMAAAALLAIACSDGPSSGGAGRSPSAGGSAISASAVRYTSCMRSHGVPEYPDPNSAGQLPKITPANEAQLGVSEARFQTAQTACQALWPYQGPTQAQQRQELTDALKFARCMRSHGVPNWPDPTTDPESGRVEFVIHPSQVGFDPHSPSPQILSKARACERGLPAYMLPSSPNGVEVTTAP